MSSRPGLYGIDGCRAGWLVVSMHGAEVHSRLPVFAQGTVAAVDMPIGLPARERRSCDLRARELLGPRRSCVFHAPVRSALAHVGDYPAASQASLEASGKKMSKQTFYLLPKIAELDEIADKTALHEAHPELSFQRWSGGTTLPPKKTKEGKAARHELVEARWPGAYGAAEASLNPKSGRWKPDDLLDAFAMLWTAERIAAGTASWIGGECDLDPHGIPMRIAT